jgi:two-component system cell cycle response regulator
MVRFNSEEVTVISGPAEMLEPKKEGRVACLIMLSGNNVGQVYPLDRDSTLIGRDAAADIQLMDAGISRRHAQIVANQDGSYMLTDAGSRNGTFANNRRIDGPHHLTDGDKVQVGVMTILKFSYGDDLEASYAQRMYDAALRDDLTGVFNRRYLGERLESEFSFSRRHGRALSLLLIDLDHFKQVNDNYGHLVGDQVLRDTAQRVQSIIRAEDVLARYGGEEFCVLCRDTDLMKASILAERIRHQTAATPHRSDQGPLLVTVSIGVVSIPDAQIETSEEFVDAADEALYQAKGAGRNCVITRRPRTTAVR